LTAVQRGRRRAALVVAVVLLAFAVLPHGAAGQLPSRIFGGGLGLEITTPVEQAFGQLRSLSHLWLEAAAAGQWEEASRLQAALLASARQLSFDRLPELSTAAGLLALDAAGRGETVAAGRLLQAAEGFDADRPETSLAAAGAARRSGRPVEALRREGQAWGRALRQGASARWLRLDLAAAPILVLLLAGALYVALAATLKGARVFHDLRRFLELILPTPLAVAVAVGLVLWPLVMPSGLLWLAAYWAIFLWGDGGWSERAVLSLFLLLLWLAPPLVAELERRRPVETSAALRSLDLLAAGRLAGTFLSDVGALQASLPDAPAARQVIADVHRRIGQWEHARSIYAELAASEPDNVAAVLGLGAYYSARGDFRRAVEWYRRGSELEPPNAAAFFNLSQAYNSSYLFDDSRRALDEARRIDAAQVGAWINAPEAPRWVVPEAAVSRRSEIHDALLRLRAAAPSPLGVPSWVVSLAAWALSMALALAAHLARQRGRVAAGGRAGPRPRVAPPRPALAPDPPTLAQWLVPGLSAVHAGAGGRAFAALLAVATLMLALFDRAWRHRLPIAFVTDGVLLPLLAGLILLAWLGGRWLWMRSEF
jgi:tetratricopeptide (TPR) repeat protein